MSATPQAPPMVAVKRLTELGRTDIPWAGGKGANLGELIGAGLPVPGGFVVGAPAFAAFADESGLREKLAELLDDLDVDDTDALDRAARESRELVATTPPPAFIVEAVEAACREIYEDAGPDAPVAVRSSATAEDTASASFAGMNETYLNVRGSAQVLDRIQACWASLFGARTIFYRAKRGLPRSGADIAVVVQRQIPSVRSGVMFTIDPTTRDATRIIVEGSFGLGEAIVSGAVSPDRYIVDKATMTILRRDLRFKERVIEPQEGGGVVMRELAGEEALAPTLDDAEARQIAQFGVRIEDHYGGPQDIEWAYDADGDAWILQARPVTASAEAVEQADAGTGEVVASGLGAAPGVAAGAVRVIVDPKDASKLGDHEVLVAPMTTPDWVPLMRRAAAIVTDSGGMTCHAAIVSRELGVPCVVGTHDATSRLRDGEVVTVDGGHGKVRLGAAAQPAAPAGGAPAVVAAAPPATGTKLLVNLAEPSLAERAAALPVDGVGLLRAELMVLEALAGDHPQLLVEEGRGDEFVERMADGLTTFAEAFSPRPITYRTIDFRTNEFRNLRGGDRFEPEEANPMIGFRGALRYTHAPEVFELEMRAIARVWDAGYHNLHVMLPFVRTERELRACRTLVAACGLLGRPGFELWVMAEVPSVLFNLEAYADLGIAGISIGSNDLTQLLLGADRDNEVLAETFDERDPAVQAYLRRLIPTARRLGLATSICGQAPSVHPEYADLLVRAGIDAISVSADAVDRTRRLIAAAEQRVLLDQARS